MNLRASKYPVSTNPWQPYRATDKAPWNLRRVVHLHRRAGFAATWAEIQRDLADGPDRSIARLLNGESRRSAVQDDFEHIADVLADAAVTSRDAMRLKAWWIYRMLFTPDPLGERLVLMWHNHLATSNLKLNDLAAMRRQNEIFREFARAPFGELLPRAVKDPAMLIWLDAQANRKEHPNENLARELMEVFTIGVGHYAEEDVKEAARSLTGWSVSGRGDFREIHERHDDGEKTVLGRRGRWRGDDLIRMLLEHPATCERVAFRVCELLMGEGTVDRSAVQALGAGLREHNIDVGWASETVLRSEAFFADENLNTRVLCPAQFVVGSVRALEQLDPPPSTLVLAEWSQRLGQDLFYPPNVFGWPGGRAWITTRSLIARANFASGLVQGSDIGRPSRMNASELAERHGRTRDDDDVVAFYGELLLGAAPSDELRDQIDRVMGETRVDEAKAGRVVAAILASPEAQLG